MTNEQLEKQISEEFEKWFKEESLFGYPKSILNETFKAAALPLMKKIEEIQKDKDQLHTYYQKCIVSLENKEIENEKLQKENEELRGILKFKDELLQSSVCLGKFQEIQKENEELREVLDWLCHEFIPSKAYQESKMEEIRTKLNLDKEGGK